MKRSTIVNKSTVVLIVVGIGVLCLSSRALAAAAGDYEMLFGQEEKVAVAKGFVSSAEFAGRLLNAAKSVGGQKDLQALLCEKAYEHGIKAPVGYQAATDAMKLLIEKMPDKKTEAQEKLLKVQQLRYARSAADDRKKIGLELVDMLTALGDDKAKAGQEVEAVALYRRALTFATTWKSGRTGEIMGKIKQLAAAQESERRIAALKARLEKDPKDGLARKTLITAYIGELDDPNEAVKLLTPDVDEGFRTYVPLVAKNVEDLAEPACIQLAEWLLTIADKSPPSDKSVLLEKAQACCERYMELHAAEDVGRLKGKMLLEKIAKATGKAVTLTATATSSSKNLTLDLGKGVTMKLVLIPAGKFMMGSPGKENGHRREEDPQRVVTISKPFYMGVTEVTQAQYEAVTGKTPSRFKGPDNPVETVSWDEAMAFCKAISDKTGRTVRLPTEAEWEYACRAGTTTAYYFGDDASKLSDYAWNRPTCGPKTHPVGQKKPNAFGVYDMYGNVQEWCSDWYGSYSDAKSTDPTGPTSGTERVPRGGSWFNDAPFCRSATRGTKPPDLRTNFIGFRVAVEVK
jgi:formylglycine-generating enzyme required for sulfatase activity